VVDVWKHLESLQACAESTMRPITQQVGVNPPHVTVHQVQHVGLLDPADLRD
jgi:hypothetical protein